MFEEVKEAIIKLDGRELALYWMDIPSKYGLRSFHTGRLTGGLTPEFNSWYNELGEEFKIKLYEAFRNNPDIVLKEVKR